MAATTAPERLSTTKTHSVRRSRQSSTASKGKSVKSPSRRQASASTHLARLRRLLDTEIKFIENDDFVGRRDMPSGVSELVRQVEHGETGAGDRAVQGMPSHLARLCETPLLDNQSEREMFMRMNFCKYRATRLLARVSRVNPTAESLAAVEGWLERAERLRNHLIEANTRLVMSIARRFADPQNGFDDLLSQGIASLIHTVEKFDYARGFRFSTYATCAVRRDLYRMVVNKKKDQQRAMTGTGELLDGSHAEEPDDDQITERGWAVLSESLREMLEQLDDRERVIITMRFGLDDDGKKSSYSRLGERLGISKERVRQLANRALDKLRLAASDRRLEALLG